MIWLKGKWALVSAAIVAAYFIYEAAKNKAEARKWQQTSVDIKKGVVKKGTMTAKQANKKAKEHDEAAYKIAEQGHKNIGKKDESTADIMAKWGVSPDTE